MSQSIERSERKERHWRQCLREWRQSGLSVRRFCQLRGLSAPSFYAWRRELARRDAQAATFVPVQVVASDRTARSGVVEVVLGGGRTVRVAPGFDAVTLRQVLAVLEEAPSC